MTIKQATQELIRECRGAEMSNCNWKQRIYDKKIAEKIGITPTALSRISTGVTAPDINTFVKILAYARNILGAKRIHELITNVLDTNSDTKSEQEDKTK